MSGRFKIKDIVVLLLVAGTGLILLQLGRGTVPEENRDFFNIGLGAWLTWGGMAVKRILDGSDSSDAKNETIARQAAALAPKDAAAPLAGGA